METLYSILGIPVFSNKQKISSAYRDLVKKHHPDKGGSAEYFDILTQAYKILSNKEYKKKYDHKLLKDEFYKNTGALNGVKRQFNLNIPLSSALNPEGCRRRVSIDKAKYIVTVPYGVKNYSTLYFKDVLPFNQILVSEIRILLPEGMEFRKVKNEDTLFYNLKIKEKQRNISFICMGKSYSVKLEEDPHDLQLIKVPSQGYVSEKGERTDLFIELHLT